ncbi:MAG: TauD/TfdA family dioxygenase [Terriglobales bacterium]
MTPVYSRQIPPTIAWKGSDLRGKEDVTIELTSAQLRVLVDRLRDVNRRKVKLGHISHADFVDSALAEPLGRAFDEIMNRRGVVVLRRLPVRDFSDEDVSRIYWGLGTYFGIGLSQSAVGDVLGNVVDATDGGKRATRGYQSNRELWLHTDNAETVGLCCVRQAKEGGESVLVNALAIHNEILASHPGHLDMLYEGFPYHRRGEQGLQQDLITPYNVPVFSNCDGQVSCFFLREAMVPALRAKNLTLTPAQRAALDCFDEISLRDDIVWRFRLEPGEVLFFNNYTHLHARTEFVNGDSPEQQRLLLRLWLDVPNGRKVVPEIHIYENAGGRGGIDRQDDAGRAKEKYLFTPAETRAFQTSRIW